MPEEKINVKFTGDARGVQQAATEAQKAVDNAAKSFKAMGSEAKDGFKQLRLGSVPIGKLKEAFAGGAAAGAILTEGLKALGTIAKTVWGWIEEKAQEAAEAIRRGR